MVQGIGCFWDLGGLGLGYRLRRPSCANEMLGGLSIFSLCLPHHKTKKYSAFGEGQGAM